MINFTKALHSEYSFRIKYGGFLCVFTFLLSFQNVCFGQNQKEGQLQIVKKAGEEVYLMGDIEINPEKGCVSFPCSINMTSGLLEVLLCRPEGKVHESLLVTSVTPLEFQTALLLLGLDPVNEVPEDTAKIDKLSPYKSIETSGDSVQLFIETEQSGKKQKRPAEYFVRDERTQSPLVQGTWFFKGAVTHQSDHVIVDNSTTMISTYLDPVTLMEINASSRFNDELFYVNENAGLTKGQPVTLIIQSVIK